MNPLRRLTSLATPLRLRGAFCFRPLALALALLMMPRVTVLEKLSLAPVAQAQDLCSPTTDRVIQAVCGQLISASDIMQFESETIDLYIAAHKMQPSEKAKLMQYGDAEARGEIRGLMFHRLLNIIHKSNRTQHEKRIHDWMGDLVWKMEKEQAQAALNDYKKWRQDPCKWKPNEEVAKALEVNYDGAAFCGKETLLLNAFQISPQLPTREYFYMQALLDSYGKRLAYTPGGAKVMTDALPGFLKATGVLVGPGAGIAVYGGFHELFPNVMRAVLRSYTKTASRALTATGAGIIISIAMQVGIEGFFKALDAEEVQQGLARMEEQANRMTNTQPDLRHFTSSAQGIYKVQAAFFDTTLPFMSTGAQPPAFQEGNPKFVITPQGGSSLPVSQNMLYEDWVGNKWMVHNTGSWFARQLLAAVDVNASAHGMTPSMRYIDWNGARMLATRVGPYFQIDKAEPADSDLPCPADPYTGLSQAPDFTKCSSYVSRSIQTKYFENRNSVEMTQDTGFTTANYASFTNGAARTEEIRATGTPLPNIKMESSYLALPSGVTFEGSSAAGLGKARIVFSGNAPSGNYPIVISASSGSNTVTQTVTVQISSVLQITSPSSANFTWGVPGSFRVTTTGSFPINFDVREPIFLPLGLSLANNGDGSLTLSGTPLPGQGVNSCMSPFPALCVTVSNSVSSVSQTVKLDMANPNPIALNRTSAEYISGIANPVQLVAGPAQGPVTIDAPCGLPAWLQLIERGNGVATLHGVAPVGAASQNVYIRSVLTTLKNQPVNCAAPPSQFQVIVNDGTVFTSDNQRSVTVGNFNYFNVTTNKPGNFVSLEGALPTGVTYANGSNGQGQLSLFPVAGSGGSYPVKFSAAGASQDFLIDVYEAPKIGGYTTMNFIVGQQNEYRIPVDGYPKQENHRHPFPLSMGMRVTGAGQFPGGVRLYNTDEFGANTGSPVLRGNPAAGSEGIYRFTVNAENGVGSASVKEYTIYVVKMGDINADGVVGCPDVSTLRAAMGARVNTATYDIRSDLNRDGVVDIRDLALVSAKLPTGTRCQ